MVVGWEGVFFKNDWKEFLLKNDWKEFLLKNERGRGAT